MSAETAYSGLGPSQRLAAIRAAACTEMPYLRSALLALVPLERPGLNTFGVTKGMVLLWDPAAIMRWSRQEAICSILHEVWHILRDHAGRRDQMQAEHRLWNIATDAEINDDLHAAYPDVVGCKIGDGWVLPEGLNLKNGGIAESYYNQLRQHPPQMMAVPNVGGGWCGSGGGAAVPNEPDEDCTLSDPQQPQTGQPQTGIQPSIGRTPAEVESVRKRVAKAIQEDAQKLGRGSIPGGWERWATVTLRPPKVRWQDKLARTACAAIAYRAGSVDWTYKKMARGQAGVGYGQGRPILHSTHSPIPVVDVWVDTSGSMSENELSAALREVRGILMTRAIVRFGTIDAVVQTSQVVKDWRELPKLLKGGGGTDFRPAFAASAKRRDGVGRVLIFITDGCGPAPDAPPPGVHVIWLLVGSYRSKPCEWGDVIEIDNDEESAPPQATQRAAQ